MWYLTNIWKDNERVYLNQEQLKELYVTYGDGQGYLQAGYYCELDENQK